MGTIEKINLGVVGACGRGASLGSACDALECVSVHAVCDINTDELDKAAEQLGAREKYASYEDMLQKSELDCVIIGTPMQLHVEQSIMALNENLHVLCEVTAGVSLEECRKLVEVCKTSKAAYMLSENYINTKPNTMIRELVRKGLFGTPYYAEGEYLHELKALNEQTTWRRKWQNGIDGITYGTHSLGPILQWMAGNRVGSVCCAGSGRHYTDPRGDEYAQDTSVMLCRMEKGELVKIRVDMISDRPHSMANYQLQGTDGCYESARAPGEKNRIWLRAKCDTPDTWLDLEELEEEFMSDLWREADEAAKTSGHGGGDYFALAGFINAVQGKCDPVIGIHEAMDMTLPGLLSQRSIAEGGSWVDVPDSRKW